MSFNEAFARVSALPEATADSRDAIITLLNDEQFSQTDLDEYVSLTMVANTFVCVCVWFLTFSAAISVFSAQDFSGYSRLNAWLSQAISAKDEATVRAVLQALHRARVQERALEHSKLDETLDSIGNSFGDSNTVLIFKILAQVQ
jgi:hypothetical protein